VTIVAMTYAGWLRPHLARWGAADHEVARVGAEFWAVGAFVMEQRMLRSFKKRAEAVVRA
jgi:hypothetical protein